MKGNTSNTNSQACAACKFQRRKCSPECPLAPYFPADQPKQFLNVHKLYGVSNTLSILKQVDSSKRNDAMKSILYEADARDRDPVHGCFGIITFLQTQAEMLREEVEYVRAQAQLVEQQQTLAYNYSAQQQLHPHSNNPHTAIISTMSTTTDHFNGAGAFDQSWQKQFSSMGTSPTAVSSWLYQYMATSPHMQAQVDACGANSIVPSSCVVASGFTSTKPTSLDVRPSFDTRSLIDYEPQQHSFHDSAPKAEAYDSSGESSIVKDPRCLEHDELESAAANLFTLTSGHSS